jgi:uncharacterized protein (DUF1800 family)
VVSQPAVLSPTAIALNRFGLGARPDDTVPADPRRWLTDQFARFDVRPAGFASLGDGGDLMQRYRDQQRNSRQTARQAGAADPKSGLADVRKAFRQDVQALYRAGVQARTDSALATQAPFVERMVHFWSNHFCISVDNARVAAFAGAFERDAIRPHVLGTFADLLLAVEQHPAMLMYLNQAQSIGPDSPAAARNPDRRRGLNENLAREIMELHTLGVRSGYSQADVTEFARALTGWTIDGAGGAGIGGSPDQFAFRPARHEPGARTILGKRYAGDGAAQARAALLDFAQAPATAHHIATKLARHFAGDDPPAAMVARLADSFMTGRGDLPSVYHTLIASPEAWVATPAKFKTPWEWTISSLRGLGRAQVGELPIAAVLSQLGQRVWKPGSPAGWDDIAASWAAPDALMRRVEIAQRLAAAAGGVADARALAARIMPASLSSATADQIARAESPAGAIALMLVSPDFLRR